MLTLLFICYRFK